LIIIYALDAYLDNSRVEIGFKPELTNKHIDEMLYFKDMEIPDFLKLFYQQTNGLLIESEYFLDDMDDPAMLLVISLEDLSFSTEKLNFLPNKRYIRFAGNEEDSLYLLDTDNTDPEGNPLILLNLPAYQFCIPLTNSFATLLECACLGLLAVIEHFAIFEGKKIPEIPPQMLKKSKKILPYLKEFFTIAKREYDLLDIWHVSPKAKKLIKKSITLWFKGLKKLLAKFQE
jgi:hypothetical protein